MDYTKQELRPLIYKDREDIDEFDIDNPQTLDAEMLRRMECSIIVNLDGANKYILDIFNNAYYITTLIMMERHPVHYLSKYILIAEHTSSAYYDIYKKTSGYKLISAIIMAMVNNYIRLLDDKYLKYDNIFINHLNNYFNEVGPFPEQDVKTAYQLYNYVSLNTDLKDYSIKRDIFKPRSIDYQAVYEAESLLNNGKNLTWRSITNDYNRERIVELLDFCKNEQSALFLASHIRREAEGYNQEETLNFIDTLDWKKLSTLPPKKVSLENENAWLRHKYVLLSDENKRVKITEDCKPDINLKSEIEDLKEQLQMLQNKNKGLSSGINQAQTALFGLSIANAFGFNYTNKKKDLAPILHELFGWGTAKIAAYLATPCDKEERDHLANLFKDLCPKLYATIMNWGELPPEVTPKEKKVTPRKE